MVSKEMIDRMGFDGWADNEFVNLVENFVMPGSGKIEINSPDSNIKFKWDDAFIYCFIRVYTEYGWKTYERELRR